MTSLKPYLIRAAYDWIVDNQLTPYILVNTEHESVRVPAQYVQDGKIILNIRPEATENLLLSNDTIEFDARFGGVPTHIAFPVAAVLAIYAKEENGKGIIFDENEGKEPTYGQIDSNPKRQRSKKPNLKIVK